MRILFSDIPKADVTDGLRTLMTNIHFINVAIISWISNQWSPHGFPVAACMLALSVLLQTAGA